MLIGKAERFSGLFLFFSLIFGFASSIDLKIKDDGNLVFLQPKTGPGRVETQWNLKTCKGCKLVLACVFKTASCKTATVKVDIGGEFSQHCPDPDWMAFSNTSNRDVMSITIDNVGAAMGAYCQVKSTIAYIDDPEEIVDSSEHGLGTRKANSCRCGWTNKSPKRIVGGREADINEYPFIALIMETKKRFPFCGGSIITEKHVLTAAHCTYPKKGIALSVILGEHDIRTWKETSATKVIDVVKMIDHPKYDDDIVKNDISILVLKEKITFSQFVGRVCVPKAIVDLQNEYLRVMGWGLTQDEGKASPILRKVDVKVIKDEVCRVVYNTNPSQQICTFNNNKDSCQGDSGGPLVRNDRKSNLLVQEAVVSFGRKCASTDPGVNTKVAAYMDWVKKQVAGSELCTID